MADNKQLILSAFIQREEERYHHSYDEELLQYEYIREGDMRSVPESIRLFRGNINGNLSSDPLRHKKYLFVAATTLATRFAIEGGMVAQDAYNLSDLYIRKMDGCTDVPSVDELETQMITEFTEKVAESKKQAQNVAGSVAVRTDISKAVYDVMDYVYYHLHEKITLNDVAEAAHMSPNHLNTVFKKEQGTTILSYVRRRKIEAAKNMLLYSDYSETEIAEFLAFSSESHFIRIFKAETGQTPKEFSRANFRRHSRWHGNKNT